MVPGITIVAVLEPAGNGEVLPTINRTVGTRIVHPNAAVVVVRTLSRRRIVGAEAFSKAPCLICNRILSDIAVDAQSRRRVRVGAIRVCDSRASRLIEVPDADVIGPNIRRLLGRDSAIAVIEYDLRVRGRRRKPHPDERFASSIPCVDLVRQDGATLVHEHHVTALGERKIVVVEASDCRLAQLDECRNCIRDRR